MVTATVPPIVARARLRNKNQLTLPDAVARAIGAQPGDRFRVWIEDDTIQFQKIGASAYGKFPGLWGSTSEEVAAHLDALRDEWDP